MKDDIKQAKQLIFKAVSCVRKLSSLKLLKNNE